MRLGSRGLPTPGLGLGTQYTHTQRERERERERMLWVGLQTTANTIPALCSERRETRLNYYLKLTTLTSHLLLDLQWRAFGITVLKNGCNDEDKNDSLSVKNPFSLWIMFIRDVQFKQWLWGETKKAHPTYNADTFFILTGDKYHHWCIYAQPLCILKQLRDQGVNKYVH